MLMQAQTVPCRDVEVPVPADLRQFGTATKARLFGDGSGPLVVALGGISADRFVCEDPHGQPGWWCGLVGRGRAVDPAHCRILGLDFAADSTGRTAPSTVCQARILCAALDAIGAPAADVVIGASYGGMVALAMAEHFPARVRRLVAISAPAEPHPSSTAARELQRRIVELGLASGLGDEALSIARGMAMLTYRTPEEFAQRFAGGLTHDDPLGTSEAGAYLRARGDAYRAVMSPERFLSLSASIDRHRVDPSRIRQPVLVVGATSDQLVPAEQMRALAHSLPTSELHLFDCLYGHDMFLKEADKIGCLVEPLLEQL
ncbi:MAG: homoserine O-succinyltransferase [Pseudomonadota bacterium]|nr:homoserine O-succinyltransferase [Pseudomonadota bacterium]